MESGAITDSQITASSAHDIGNVGPQHARYNEAFISFIQHLFSLLREKRARINKIYCPLVCMCVCVGVCVCGWEGV